MQETFGDVRAHKIADAIAHHFSGVVGYVCLGFLLGLVPFVSVFIGFPIEVRHITLASASLTYDLSSLAWMGHIPWIATIWAVLGLAATGVLNFVVSFTLGLWLAFRACRIDTSGRKALLVALGERFRRSPSTFLWSDKAVSPDTSVDSR
jgi:site-specific recombinase